MLDGPDAAPGVSLALGWPHEAMMRIATSAANKLCVTFMGGTLPGLSS